MRQDQTQTKFPQRPTTLSRRTLLQQSAGLGLASLTPAHWLTAPRRADAAIEDPIDATAPLIHAPDDPAHWPAFREELTRWRTEARKRIAYDDALYRKPE